MLFTQYRFYLIPLFSVALQVSKLVSLYIHSQIRQSCQISVSHVILCLSIFLSVYLTLYLSVQLPSCLPVSISVSITCLSVSQSVCQSVSLYVCQSVCLSVCMSVSLSVCLLQSVFLSIYLTNCPSYSLQSSAVTLQFSITAPPLTQMFLTTYNY